MTRLIARPNTEIPLVEVNFELRHQPVPTRPSDSIMPGVLLSHLGSRFTEAADLPGRQIPSFAMAQQEDLQYVGRTVVHGEREMDSQ